jgi:peptide/nickel transport system ATP-binding protein
VARLLEIEELHTYFYTLDGVVRAVDGVSLQLDDGETLGIVGESGCGKSVTALSIMRLVDEPPGRIVSGRVLFEGRNLLELSENEMQRIRGNRISMIFQEPMTSLNPVYTIGDQVAETLMLHQKMRRHQAWNRAMEMVKMVGIPSPEQRVRDYPHQLSGGMRQRVMIAIAMACNPRLMIADEPTTALDVTIQAQILRLLNRLLGVVASMARRVAVMYAGQVVEYAEVRRLYHDPLHPYTRGLLRSIPRGARTQTKDRLQAIKGVVPNMLNLPSGCRFHDRCLEAATRCAEEPQKLVSCGDGRLVRCWRSSKK